MVIQQHVIRGSGKLRCDQDAAQKEQKASVRPSVTVWVWSPGGGGGGGEGVPGAFGSGAPQASFDVKALYLPLMIYANILISPPVPLAWPLRKLGGGGGGGMQGVGSARLNATRDLGSE